MQDLTIHLEDCLQQTEASRTWFARRVLPLSLEQMRWRPGPKHWSIAECLEHLNLTLALCLPKVDAAIAAGWREGTRAELSGLRWERSESQAMQLVEPPVVARATAPAATIPEAAIDADFLVDSFYQLRGRYGEAVRRAFGLDLARIRVVEPVIPWLRSLGGVIAFLAAHDRRHMWQAERIRRSPRFPRAPF